MPSLTEMPDRVLTPEELEELKKEVAKYREDLERRKKEQHEDVVYESKEQAKLRRELRNPVKTKDPLLEKPKMTDKERERLMVEEYLQKQQGETPDKPKDPEQPKMTDKEKEMLTDKERERLMVEEYLQKQQNETPTRTTETSPAKKPKHRGVELLEHEPEQKKPSKTKKPKHRGVELLEPEEAKPEVKPKKDLLSEKELQKMLMDPKYFQQSGDLKCMTEGHGNLPAVVKLKHRGVLGDLPDLSFCEECSVQLKMVPIMENNPSEAILKRLSYYGDDVMLNKLLKLANQLDQKGFYREADQLDVIVKVAVNISGLIKVLKSDDVKAVQSEFNSFIASVPSHSTPDKELRMTSGEFKEFANAVRSGDLEKARNLLGVELGVGDVEHLDTSKYNPITGLPWSNPAKPTKAGDSLTKELKQVKGILDDLDPQVYRGYKVKKGHKKDGRIEVGITAYPVPGWDVIREKDVDKRFYATGFKKHWNIGLYKTIVFNGDEIDIYIPNSTFVIIRASDDRNIAASDATMEKAYDIARSVFDE